MTRVTALHLILGPFTTASTTHDATLSCTVRDLVSCCFHACTTSVPYGVRTRQDGAVLVPVPFVSVVCAGPYTPGTHLRNNANNSTKRRPKLEPIQI